MTYLSNMTKLPDTIPIFPLTGILLLPNARLPLNIFETKYLEMIENVLGTQSRIIGMIQATSDENEDTLSQNLSKVGCAGKVISFTETEDSRYLITLSGISRFELLQPIDTANSYLTAKVDWSLYKNDRKEEKTKANFKREMFLDILSKYLKITNLQTDWDSLRKAEDELLINSLSMLCPFDQHEKQALLEANTIKDRALILQTLMEMTIKAEKSFGPLQ
ncbi:MAG: LON peptidase substrate-binding domain-containing protein [Paracoccaceae bacterium]